MHRHGQNVNYYKYLLALTALAALGGCRGKGREELPPALGPSQGEVMREDGIVIEIVSGTQEEGAAASGAGTDPWPEAGKGPWPENGQGETGESGAGTGPWPEDDKNPGWGNGEETERAGEDGLERNDFEGIQEAEGFSCGEPGSDWGISSPDQVYPGEILRKEDVESVGADEFFTCCAISDSVFQRMDGNSYRPGCPVSREDLRYIRILHYDFAGNIRVGELVCNQSVSGDMTRIFRELYEAGYPIEKVVLIDDYGGDDDLSSQDNNTSCFNYRTVAGSGRLSLHALGVAIDVNPLYNPYITWNAQGELNYAPSNGAAYGDRSRDFPYKIDEDDLCCRLFTQAGFTWGGNWEGHQDYMHFSRGSRPET